MTRAPCEMRRSRKASMRSLTPRCHCEQRSDEAISAARHVHAAGDCFASLAMTPEKHVIARSEATKQSPPQTYAQVNRDCFASLAMTQRKGVIARRPKGDEAISAG